MPDYREVAKRKVGGRVIFDTRRFFKMFAVWFLCTLFSLFPLMLRPFFTKAATAVDMGYWKMVFSDNDVLYLAAVSAIIAIGMAVLMGKRSTVIVYLLAFFEVIAVFLATMGYLMLEGDPDVFGGAVYRMNIGFLIGAAAIALVMFVAVNINVREAEKK